MKNLAIALVLLAAVAAVFLGLQSRRDTATNGTEIAATPANATEIAATPAETAAEPAAGDTGETPASGQALLAGTAPETVYGQESAPVVIEEYASYSCSHCADFHKNVLPELKKQYIDNGKAVLRVRSFIRNQQDMAASLLVACQKDNTERQRFASALFSAQDSWAFTPDFDNALKSIARVGGMQEAQIEACMNDKKLGDALLAVRQEAADKRKIESTPYFFVNGQPLKGTHAIEDFAALINGEKKPAEVE